MRTLVMGRVIVFLIGRLFKRGRVQGAAHQLGECVFDVFAFFLEGLNRGIEPAKVGIDSLDVLLVPEIVDNQVIEFLGMGGGHLGRGKNRQTGLALKRLQVRGITTDGEKRGTQRDMWQIRVSRRVGGTTEKNGDR
jgi:hypothetical protein